MNFLHPAPELDKNALHLGGTYVIRAPPPAIEILNLKNTFCRELKPTFRWEDSKQKILQISLYLKNQNGAKRKLWERQTSKNSFPYPEDEPALQPGGTYCWELYMEGEEIANSACFYVLSKVEKEALEYDLAQLEQLAADEEGDKITIDFLKIELMKKYHLKDDLARLLTEIE